MPLLLTERDVRAVLPMADLIDAMEHALAEFSADRVSQPLRTVLEIGAERSYFGVMPAALNSPPVVGTKLVTVFAKNHDRGLPSHLATILLMDHATGALTAVMDGRYITEARTAAVSAVSVKHLARPEAETLALIGTGVQARSHLEAIRLVRPLAEVRVWSPSAAHRNAFARNAAEATGLAVRATDDAGAAVRGASIIVLATGSPTPVIDDGHVSDGAHICAVGACRPDQREMPSDLVARARLFVDSRAGALKEAGDILLPLKEGRIGQGHIVGELGQLVSARITGRRSPADVTIFKSLGMAVEDLVAAALVLERAAARGLGQKFELTT